MTFGAFAGRFNGSGTQVAQLENQLGVRVGIASSFRGEGDMFPSDEQVADANSGHTLLIAWDMGSAASDRYSTYTSGAHDTYLRAVAAQARDSHDKIFLRPWAEMNGDWQKFQPTNDGSKVAGGTPAEFVAAWRHVVEVFRAAGATNVKWVFNPTTDTYPGTTPIGPLFPGTGYVDVLGLDGYNWGDGGPGGWRTFDNIYTDQYKTIAALAPSLPVWVCETGSKEPSESDGGPVDTAHSKFTWYNDIFNSTAFPRIRAFVMFDTRKERDWRVSSTPESLKLVSDAVRAMGGR